MEFLSVIQWSQQIDLLPIKPSGERTNSMPQQLNQILENEVKQIFFFLFYPQSWPVVTKWHGHFVSSWLFFVWTSVCLKNKAWNPQTHFFHLLQNWLFCVKHENEVLNTSVIIEFSFFGLANKCFHTTMKHNLFQTLVFYTVLKRDRVNCYYTSNKPQFGGEDIKREILVFFQHKKS